MQPVIQHGYIVPLTKKENAAVSRLVRAAISRGLSIQVWNGAEYMLPQASQDAATILLMLGSSGGDALEVCDGNRSLGFFDFEWGSDEEPIQFCELEAEPTFDSIWAETFGPDANAGKE
jgi:hypothetical protein